jgi:hypothetical protein
MKKLVAVASVTALSVFVSMSTVVGCSSDPPAPSVDPDAGTDANPGKKKDVDVPDTVPPPPGCLTTETIDATQFPYKPVAKSPAACTADEASALSEYFAAKVNAGQSVVISDWAKEVSTQCSECVFSDGTGDKWTPIIVKDDKLQALNRGGCIEIMTSSAECGEAYQQVMDCRYAACSKCTSDQEFSECVGDGDTIFSGPCKDAFEKVITACGDELEAAQTACQGENWQFEGPIRAQCVTGDEGDGGTGDGG